MAVKLTDKLLRQIIKEERAKLGMGPMRDVEDVADAEELDADELGTDKSLEQPVDHMKALKIREAAFKEAIVKLAEAKAKKAAKKKDEAAKKKAKSKKPAAKKESAKGKKKMPLKKESIRMNESQLLEALASTRRKIRLLGTKKGK